MDGDIDPFIEAYLRRFGAGTAQGVGAANDAAGVDTEDAP